MKQCVFIIIGLLLFNSMGFSQALPSPAFRLADCEHIKSFGQECDILVFKDHNVVRDIFIVEPSIAFSFNRYNDALLKSNKILVLTSIFKNKGQCVFKDTQIRCYKDSILIQDDTMKSIVLSAMKNIQVRALKLTSKNQSFYFGFILVRKQGD